MSAQLSINEAFAARRATLLAKRHKQFSKGGFPDFAPREGFCVDRNIHLPGEPRCNYDLVAHYGDEYPTAMITGCPHCGSSYCD